MSSEKHTPRYSLIILIGALLLSGCTYSGMLEDIEDLGGASRYFTTAAFNGDLVTAITSAYPEDCGQVANAVEAANCACQTDARLAVMPKAENFRALISTSYRHFACNLQDKDGSYCDYKIRPGRRLYFHLECPQGENCPQDFSPMAHNLQSFLEDGPTDPTMYMIQFMAGFDSSLRTAANCANFTTADPGSLFRFWDIQAFAWPGGISSGCDSGGPLFCIDKY